MAKRSEVALFERTFAIFKNKIDDVFTDVPVSVWGQKHILIVLIAPRWRASNKFQGFLMVPDLRSCTLLSTLPLFYIAQSVNSDDRRVRF